MIKQVKHIHANEKPHEECAVFGVSLTTEEAAGITYNGLITLQHRGQEGAGIAVANNRSIVRQIGADSLGYISIEGLKKACVKCKLPFCTACFTGNSQAICAKKNIFE